MTTHESLLDIGFLGPKNRDESLATVHDYVY
jgi:hypothetical protein